MEDIVVNFNFIPFKPQNNINNLWDNLACDGKSDFNVTGDIINWFEENNIILRYNYILPTEFFRNSWTAIGVEFRFDNKEDAVYFKLIWGGE